MGGEKRETKMRVLVVILIQTIWSTLTDDEDMYEGSGADMRMIADKSVKNNESNESDILPTIIGVSVAALFIISMIIFCGCYYHKKSQTTDYEKGLEKQRL